MACEEASSPLASARSRPAAPPDADFAAVFRNSSNFSESRLTRILSGWLRLEAFFLQLGQASAGRNSRLQCAQKSVPHFSRKNVFHFPSSAYYPLPLSAFSHDSDSTGERPTHLRQTSESDFRHG